MQHPRAAPSRQLLEQIISSALDAFVVVDADSKILVWSPQAQTLFGWSEAEALGRPLAELIIPPEQRQAHAEGMRRYLATGQSNLLGRRVEVMALHRSGQPLPIELSITPASLDGRQIFSAAMRDITERRALEEQYRSTVDRAPVGIAHLDVSGQVLSANRKACEILGYELHELQALESHAISHPADRDVTARHLRPLLEGKADATTYEKRFFHKAGHVLWLRISLSLLREPSPNQGCVIAVFDDITEARMAHERAGQLATVIEATSDFVGFAEPSGKVLYINRAGRRMVGVGDDQSLEGLSIRAKYPDWAFEVVKAGIAHATAHGTWTGESAIRGADGREIPTSQVIIAHRDGDGKVGHISTIIRDISERYATEQALRDLDRRKDEFLAMLAHELRNPLAPIATAAQLLKRPGLDPARVTQATAIIGRQVSHMTKLLDDLLDVSRVTRGLIAIQSEPVDLRAVAVDAVEQARPLFEQRHHRLVVQSCAQAITVRGDATRLVQMLVNVLNNAAKYTPEGGTIAFEMRVEAGEVRITVQDNGIGMSAQTLPHVFELFTQARRSSDRAQGGLGLGLALARSVAELHGGRIEAHSAGEGQGSVFTIRLPVAAAGVVPDTAAHAAERAGHAQPLRVLVVDDNIDAAHTLGMLIETAGHVVHVAHDAHAALRVLGELRPHACLLDVGLPDIDGYELARRIRQAPGGARAVLVAVTGYGQREDLAQARSAGFDHHLLKPADPSRLLALLQSLGTSPG